MKRAVVLMGFMLVLALLGCNPQLFGRLEPGPAGLPDREEGSTGTVRLTIPSLSAHLARALGVLPQVRANRARAFLIVSKVDLELYLEGELVDQTTVPLDLSPSDRSGSVVEWSLIPAASGYQVVAYLYNDNVDPDTPILSGTSETFTVAAGEQTDTIWIRPTPVAPAVLYGPGSYASQYLYSCWDTGATETVIVDPGPDGIEGTADDITMEVPVYGWAEERWFQLNTSGQSAVQAIVDDYTDTGVYFMVADSQGRIVTQAISGCLDGGPAYWDYGDTASAGFLTSGSPYYVGLITISEPPATSVYSGVSVSFQPFADDAYEENDSWDEAWPITVSTAYSGIDLDPLEWDYINPPEGGDWYSFELASGEGPGVTVSITFDHDVADLALHLFRWTGSDLEELGYSDDSLYSGPGDVVPESEVIEATLDPGTYYVWVRSNTFPVGAGYQLLWVLGTGSAVIGFE